MAQQNKSNKKNILGIALLVIGLIATAGASIYISQNSTQVENAAAGVDHLNAKYQQPQVWFGINGRSVQRSYPSDYSKLFLQPSLWADSFSNLSTFVFNQSAYTMTNTMEPTFIKNNIAPLLKEKEVSFDTITPSFMSCRRASISDQVLADKNQIQKLMDNGVKVTSIKMQSSLAKPVPDSLKSRCTNYTLAQRINDMVTYAQAMHKFFPDVEFGVVDPTAAHELLGNDWKSVLAQTQQRFNAAGEKLSFLILDRQYDYNEFGTSSFSSLEKVKELETYLRDELGIKFGMILTASDRVVTSNKAYYDYSYKYLDEYIKIGGSPDFYFVESWQKYPENVVPETGSTYSHTQALLRIQNKIKAEYSPTPHRVRSSVRTALENDYKIVGWATQLKREGVFGTAYKNMTIRLYIDQPATKNKNYISTTADISRGDRKDWFLFAIPNAYRDNKYHTAYLYAVSQVDGTTLIPLKNSPFQFRSGK